MATAVATHIELRNNSLGDIREGLSIFIHSKWTWPISTEGILLLGFFYLICCSLLDLTYLKLGPTGHFLYQTSSSLQFLLWTKIISFIKIRSANFYILKYNCAIDTKANVCGVTANIKSALILLNFSQTLKPACIPNNCLLPSVPSAFSQHKDSSHSLSFCLFVFTSFTTVLAAVSILQPFSHGREHRAGCRWHGPPPIQSIPLHSPVHTCGKARLQQYKHTKRLHSYTHCLSA